MTEPKFLKNNFSILKNLDGRKLGDYRIKIAAIKQLPLAGWLEVELRLNSRLVFQGIFSAGGKGINPWFDLEYIAIPRGSKKSEVKLFKRLSETIPPGGHIMISYEGGGEIHSETRRGLEAGIPAVLTPIDFFVFSAGFHFVKDWYLAEGGNGRSGAEKGVRIIKELRNT